MQHVVYIQHSLVVCTTILFSCRTSLIIVWRHLSSCLQTLLQQLPKENDKLKQGWKTQKYIFEFLFMESYTHEHTRPKWYSVTTDIIIKFNVIFLSILKDLYYNQHKLLRSTIPLHIHHHNSEYRNHFL